MPNVTVTIPQKHRLPLGGFLSKPNADLGEEHQLQRVGELLALLSPTAKNVNIALPDHLRDCAVYALKCSDDKGLWRLAKLFEGAK